MVNAQQALHPLRWLQTAVVRSMLFVFKGACVIIFATTTIGMVSVSSFGLVEEAGGNVYVKVGVGGKS